MRAAVRQAQQRAIIRQHGADDVVVVLVVANDREEQELVRPGREVIVGDLIGRVIGPLGDRLDAFVRAGLVVRRIAHREDAVPALGDVLAELRQAVQQLGRRRLGQDLPAHLGVLHPLDPFRDRQLQQRLVAGPDGERV